MASTDDAPRRGEVWLVSFGAGRGGEPSKNRPAIVVLPDALQTGTAADLVPVVPLSSSAAPSAMRPEVPQGAGVERPSRAICRGVRGVTPSRLLRRLGSVSGPTLGQVDQALAVSLGIDVDPTR